MKTEIGGTLKWSDKARAYAAAFREGDAVKVDGKWAEVKRYENTHAISTVFTLTPEANPYNLNYAPDGENRYKGTAKGFLKSRVKTPFEIVAPKDYEVQEGDKLVWLGETVEYHGCSELTFGETYEVFRSEDGYLFYKNDMTTALLANYLKEEGDVWGIIPRYENVKEKEEMCKEFKFSVGDVVRGVDNDSLDKCDKDYVGVKDVVKIVDSMSEALPYAIEFETRDYLVWFAESALESAQKDIADTTDFTITRDKHTVEQQAIELLIELSEEQTHAMLQDEVKRATKVFLDKNDYKNAKRAIDIIEQLGRK